MQQEAKAFAVQYKLSPRETDIFFLLVNRIITFKDIAQHLKLSPSTINNHFKSIFEKTQTNSKSELLAVFIAALLVKSRGNQPLIKNPTVMVIDDEPDLCDVIAFHLSKRGIKVHTFTDPTLAIEALAGLRVDAVITDIRMPKMSGIELLQTIRRHYHYSPSILFISGYAMDQSIETVMDMGAVALLEKPLDMDRLFHHVMEQFIEDNFVRSAYLKLEEKTPVLLEREFQLGSSDIGYGGVFLRNQNYNCGEAISFKFKLENHPESISAVGEVVWQRESQQPGLTPGVGVKFLQIAPLNNEVIQTYVRQHKILSFVPIGKAS